MYPTKSAFMDDLQRLVPSIPKHMSIPALASRKIRIFPTGTTTYRDVPRVCHPEALAGDSEDGMLFRVLLGEPWVQTSWFVRSCIDSEATANEEEPPDNAGEEPDDADFVYDDDSEEDKTSWISEDSSLSSSGESLD
ncbi:hypothetical protein C8Q80DRAFT_1264669 [Daedaleopsis nitida]|nr:hypothetical protein C8Q80DRAFT_1264669 [Daedaleopsis nitida]